MDVATDQPTVKEMLVRMDEGWAAFSNAVHALPAELLEGKLGEHRASLRVCRECGFIRY